MRRMRMNSNRKWEKTQESAFKLSMLRMSCKLVELAYSMQALLKFLYVVLFYSWMSELVLKVKMMFVYMKITGEDSSILLMLDLDGTLVSTSDKKTANSIPLQVGSQTFHLKRRPNLDAFLNYAIPRFQVGVYTASKKEYADAVIHELGLSKVIPKDRRLYRDSCRPIKGVFLKDLLLIEPDLSRVLIIDDTPRGLKQIKNSIVIPTWNNGDDDYLIKCIKLLSNISEKCDVREYVLDLGFY